MSPYHGPSGNSPSSLRATSSPTAATLPTCWPTSTTTAARSRRAPSIRFSTCSTNPTPRYGGSFKRHRRISEFDSENLTYALLERVLEADPAFRHLGVLCHQPLRQLIRDWTLLDNERAPLCLERRHTPRLPDLQSGKQTPRPGCRDRRLSVPQTRNPPIRTRLDEESHPQLLRTSAAAPLLRAPTKKRKSKINYRRLFKKSSSDLSIKTEQPTDS